MPALMVTAGKDVVLHPSMSQGMEEWVSPCRETPPWGSPKSPLAGFGPDVGMSLDKRGHSPSRHELGVQGQPGARSWHNPTTPCSHPSLRRSRSYAGSTSRSAGTGPRWRGTVGGFTPVELGPSLSPGGSQIPALGHPYRPAEVNRILLEWLEGLPPDTPLPKMSRL